MCITIPYVLSYSKETPHHPCVCATHTQPNSDPSVYSRQVEQLSGSSAAPTVLPASCLSPLELRGEACCRGKTLGCLLCSDAQPPTTLAVVEGNTPPHGSPPRPRDQRRPPHQQNSAWGAFNPGPHRLGLYILLPF